MDVLPKSFFPPAGGELGARVRAHDWAATPVGPIEDWPEVLRTSVTLILDSPESMYLVWGPDLTFFFNDAYRPILGPRLPDALGASLPALWPDAWDAVRSAVEKGFGGEASRFVDLPIAMNRYGVPEDTWWTFSYSPVRDGSGQVVGLLCITSETTDRVRATTALRASEARNRQILDSATDYAIVATDLDGRVTRWNEGARHIIGWTEEEMLGQPIGRFFTPEDNSRGQVEREMSGALRAGRGTDERWHLRRNGERFWALGEMTPLREESGEVIGFVKVLCDRTAQRLAAEALEQSERRYRILYEAIDAGFCIVEVRCDEKHVPNDYRFLEVNPAFEKQTGLKDATGRWMRDLAPDHEQYWFDTYQRIAETGQSVRFEFEARALGDRWYEVHAYRVGAPNQHHVAILFNDISARKVNEAKLIENEAKLQEQNITLEQRVAERTRERDQIWQNSRDMLGVADAQGVWLSVNPAWSRILGWRPENIVGRTSEWMEHPEDRSKTRAEIGALATGRTTFEFENRFRARDGEFRTLSWTAAPEGGLLYCVARDVTEIRAQATALAEQAAARERSWSYTPDLLSIIDMPSAAFERVNPTWTATLGWSAEEVEGRPFTDFLHPDDASASVAALEAARQGKPVLRFENRYRTKGGDWRWLSWVAFPEGDKLYSSTRDVTADKERAAALHLFENIVQSDDAPICAFDHEFRLIAFNKAHSDEFFRIFAHRVQIGEVFPDLFPPDQSVIMRGFMARALQGEAYTVTEEFGDPDLAKPYWEVVYTPLRDDTGRVVGAFHHARDISERLRALAELAATQEALRQSQKMEAVGQLTGGLAHDFNNLLTGVTGSLELMQKRIARGRIDDIERYINAAQGAAKRAAALTHRLLAFSRRQTLDPKPTDINQLVRGMEDLIRRTMGPQITVQAMVEMDGLWPTLVDPGQLENALLNLCINARDAMPDGGKLTVEASNRRLDERAARERDLTPGAYVSLCVSDTGTGMSPEVAAKAFDPFFTTKPIGMGTGLGLSMIYGFAKQSGGQARIHSQPGHGATVCLYLPRHLGKADTAEPDPELTEAPRAENGQTVLVVDDEPTVRMLVTDVLEDLGYTAIEAADGAAGLKILQSNVRIDLLVTDVGLPGGMNGRQVADAARVARPGLKVLFITGYAENAVLSHGHLDPGMHVLTKPFAMEALASRIKELIST